MRKIVLGRLMKLLCLVSVCDSDTGNITTARAFEFNSKEKHVQYFFTPFTVPSIAKDKKMKINKGEN